MFRKISKLWEKILISILIGVIFFFIVYSYLISISLFPFLALLGVILIVTLLQCKNIKNNKNK